MIFKKIYCGHKTYRLFNIFSYGKEHFLWDLRTCSGPQWAHSSVICCHQSCPWCSWSCLWGLEVSLAALCWPTSGTGTVSQTDSLSSVDRSGVGLKRCVMLKWPDTSQAQSRLCHSYRLSGCCVTLTWRIKMLRLMKAGKVSVLATTTSMSPNVFLSLSQYTQSGSCEHKNMRIYTLLHVPGAYKVYSVCKAHTALCIYVW